MQREPEQPLPKPDYFLGLDLGQAADPTALATLERRPMPSGKLFRYTVSYLRRWQLRTSYPDIVSDVRTLLDTPHPRTSLRPLRNCVLATDQTGVGAAVTDMLKQAKLPCRLHPVLITTGHQVTRENGIWHVAKKELVSVLQVLLQSGRLEVVATLPQAEILKRELGTFKVKITAAGNETLEAWRERDHDDLVLAVAMAAWLGERLLPEGDGTLGYIPPMGGVGGRFNNTPGRQLPPGYMAGADWRRRR